MDLSKHLILYKSLRESNVYSMFFFIIMSNIKLQWYFLPGGTFNPTGTNYSTVQLCQHIPKEEIQLYF